MLAFRFLLLCSSIRMRGLLLITGCLWLQACGHASVVEHPKASIQTSGKATASDLGLFYLGRPQPEAVVQESVPYLTQCFVEHLNENLTAAVFMLKFSGSRFEVVEGRLENADAVTECLNSQKGFRWSDLAHHWLWTENLKPPKVVGKNWVTFSTRPRIFQKSEAVR